MHLDSLKIFWDDPVVNRNLLATPPLALESFDNVYAKKALDTAMKANRMAIVELGWNATKKN